MKSKVILIIKITDFLNNGEQSVGRRKYERILGVRVVVLNALVSVVSTDLLHSNKGA